VRLLNEHQAVFFADRSRTDQGRSLAIAMVKLYVAWRRGEVLDITATAGNHSGQAELERRREISRRARQDALSVLIACG